jgi:hypothetical protein
MYGIGPKIGMIPVNFYILIVGLFTQYKYAWFEVEPGGDCYTRDGTQKCPVCGDVLGSLLWLPPRKVAIKQPRRISDIISGAGGSDFLVTRKFMESYIQENLTGLEGFFPVEVVKMGTTKKAKDYTIPELFGVYVKFSNVRIIKERMGIRWQSDRKVPTCDFCDRGEGILTSFERVVVDESTWQGEDFFRPINGSNYLLSQKAKDWFDKNQFENVSMPLAIEFSYDSLDIFKTK